MTKKRAEMPPDPAAEQAARQEKRAKKERAAEKARARAKKSYQRRKAAEKGAAPQTSAAPDADAATEQTPPASDQGPMGDLADEAAAAGDADASVGEVVIDGPEQLAELLARAQRTGQVLAVQMEKVRFARVVAALEWADRDGRPTRQCTFACALVWPWIEEQGLATLDDFLTPGVMALFGAALLVGPAIAVGVREYRAHEVEEKEAAAKKPAAGEKSPAGGRVIDGEYKREVG